MFSILDCYYQDLATCINDLIDEEWSNATVEAIFFADGTTFLGEYTRASDGVPCSFLTNIGIQEAFIGLRNAVRQSGQPLWGRVRFEINAHGKFTTEFEYDSCDAAGNYQMDEDEYSRYIAARHKRLTSD